ncbi:luciferase family protein [Ruegeria sp. ANG10]|uniref:luciferase domain-containing protein n=1 Tax=Ruegeria sp. ANG10 TaxID=3042467 RepID=UPI003454DC77
MSTPLTLPKRSGPLPETQGQLPHSQLTQHGPDEIIDALHAWCFALPNVNKEDSGISVPGSRALVLHDGVSGNQAAFMIGREFAHIHPKPDNGSMHLVLPVEDVAEVKRTGWGEDHYLVTQGQWPIGLVMIYSPRDEDELDTAKKIVARSYEFATGQGVAV